MGFWSGVCSFVSSACSAISSAVSSIGRGVAAVATSIVSLGMTLAGKVGETIKGIAVSLGILKPEDKMDELGEKAMMSDKKPEDFESMNEYIDHLQNDVKIDKEKFDKLDKAELLARSGIGAAITLKGIEEKLETSISPEFLAAVAKQDLAADEIIQTIKTYKEKELDTDDYSLYVDDEMSLDESDKHSDALVSVYQKLEPDMTIEQIEEKVMNLSSGK